MKIFSDRNDFYTTINKTISIRLGKNALRKSMNVALKKKICLIRRLAESYFLLAKRIEF